MMSELLYKWTDSILGLFASYRPGEGMKYQTIEAKYGRTFGKERLEYLFVYYNLLENSLLEQKDNYFVTLTDKGFEYINSDERGKIDIYFEFVKPLSKDRDEMFANLWHLIGKKDNCLCYVDGPTFFNSISVFLPILGSYSEYMKELHEKTGNNSRISWYKDLFYKLPKESVEPFLEKLSELYGHLEYNENGTKEGDVESIDFFENNTKQDMTKKKNKIFISHCGKDKVAVGALVDLLGEVIHLSGDNLFCSSVHGFDVMLGKNFMDNIMEQYKENNLLVLYVLSFNYMDSPICLNEMGASWMTKTDSIGILLPGFDIDDLGNSCYDKQSISVIFKQEVKEVKHRLNQLKETVEALFPNSKTAINWSRWEEKRDEFIEKVMALPSGSKASDSEVTTDTPDLKAEPKASISSSVYYKGKGSYEITFTNLGNGTAEELSIDFDDVDGIFLMMDKDLFPIEILKAGRSFQIHAMMTEGTPHKMMSHIQWKEGDLQFMEDELVLFNH